jgi:Xaa-Pro aminopeptidase
MINKFKIPEHEFQERIKKVQQAMKEQDIDILLAFGNEAEPQFVRYLCNYWPSFETAGVIIASEGNPILIIGPESATYAQDRSKIKNIKRVKVFRESSDPVYPGIDLDTFDSILHELLPSGNIKRVGIAGYSLIPMTIYRALDDSLKKYKETEIVKADHIIMQYRMIKSENELKCMRYAGEITRNAFDYVLAHIKPGMTEIQVQGLASSKMFEMGAESMAYPIWILAGVGGNQAISRPRNKVISKGEIVQIQIGARYEGYVSTIGRPIVFGKPQPWQTDAIKAGYEGHDAISDVLKVGNNASNVANTYFDTMKKNGYTDWLLYGPCHGTGLMEGEPPWIESDSDYVLKENMTYCMDVFMGNKNGAGFRIEDSVRVGIDRADSFTNYRNDVIIL